MCDVMSFPATVDEFMEQYKIVDREEVYTNGAEMVPIFRMKQWFEHEALGKDTNVPTNSALDHIHNVVRDDAYRRGYEQGKKDVPDMNVGDMISRQAATTIPVMPKEHRHYQTNNLDDAYEQGWNDLQECIENLPPIQPNHNAEPGKMVDDTVSRQVAMEMLMAQNVIMDGSEYHNGFNAGVNRAQEVIRNLPPVQPQRTKGEWITSDDLWETGICSCCGWDSQEPVSYAVTMFKFCPNCGADMRGKSDADNY